MPEKTQAAARLRLPNIAARLFEEPLLIHPRKLNTVINVLAPRMFEGLEVSEDMLTAAHDPFLSGHHGDVSSDYQTIGIIPIHGLRSYESIREDFDEALENPNIDAILFDIDSGGGEAAGVFDLANYIAKNRGSKPIYAFANEHAYSAAYAIACAADQVYLPRTGGVGSIGVVAVHLDQSGFDTKAGLNYTPIFAGARKIDGWPHAPLSEDALSRMQERVNVIYEIFTNTVAENRGLSESRVIQTEADCFDGEQAVQAGLADGLASLDELVEIIATDIETQRSNPVSGHGVRESSGKPGETTTLKKGEKPMGIKSLTFGKSRRAAKSEEKPEDDETLNDPIEDEEAENEEEENLENESEEDKALEDEEDEDLIEDDEEEDLETDEDDETAFKAGRDEAMEILSLCKLYGKPALAENFLRKGYNAEQVRKRLLAKRNAQLKSSSQSTVISNRQSAKTHSGQGGVVAAVKNKLGMKE
jgi:signal peptide peptidase SppA